MNMTFEDFSSVEKEGILSFKKKVLKECGNRAILFKVFGSKVRGEDWEESDIDILVLVEDLDWREKERIIDLSSDVNLEYDLMISPLVMTPQEFDRLLKRERRLALDIVEEGISL